MKRSCYHRILVLISLSVSIHAYGLGPLGAGRGGPYFEFHAAGLTGFDPSLVGNALIVGGVGFGAVGKKVRLGGGGGGGFLWDSAADVSFGMGYGGVIGEYGVTDWLNFSLMIGGGGFAVAKILSETETQTTYEKVSSGGFVLFYPMVSLELPLKGFGSICGKLGYFLPNNSKLHSFTIGITLLFGKL